jgi:Flp pilus assembly protein TadD
VAFVPTGWCEPYARMLDGYRALQQPDGIAYATGMVAFCDNRPTDAVAALKSIGPGPYAEDALLGLALISAAQGDRTAATTYYQRVLANDPSNASALIGLGQIGGGDAHVGLQTAAPSGAP